MYESIERIVTETLEYYLADDVKKVNIIRLFMMIANFCYENALTAEKNLNIKEICDLWIDEYSYKEILENSDKILDIRECLKI